MLKAPNKRLRLLTQRKAFIAKIQTDIRRHAKRFRLAAATAQIDGAPLSIDRLTEAATMSDGKFDWDDAIRTMKVRSTAGVEIPFSAVMITVLRPLVAMRHALKNTTLGEFVTTENLRSFLPHQYADKCKRRLPAADFSRPLLDIDYAAWTRTVHLTPLDEVLLQALQTLKDTSNKWCARNIEDVVDELSRRRLTFDMSCIVGSRMLGSAFDHTCNQINGDVLAAQVSNAPKENKSILFVTSTPRNSKSTLLDTVLDRRTAVSKTEAEVVTLRATYNSDTPFDKADAHPARLARRLFARAVASLSPNAVSRTIDELERYTPNWQATREMIEEILGRPKHHGQLPFILIAADEFSRVVDAAGPSTPKLRAAYSKISAALEEAQIVFSGFRVGATSAFATMSGRNSISYFLPNLVATSRVEFAPLLCALSLLGGLEQVAYECMKHSAGLLGYVVERLASQTQPLSFSTPWAESLKSDSSTTVPAVIQALRRQFSDTKFRDVDLDRFQRLHLLAIVDAKTSFVSPYALWALRETFDTMKLPRAQDPWRSRLARFWSDYSAAVEAYAAASSSDEIITRKGRVAEVLCRVAVELRALARGALLTCVTGRTADDTSVGKPLKDADLTKSACRVDAFPCLESFKHVAGPDGTGKVRIVQDNPTVLSNRRRQFEQLLELMQARCLRSTRAVAAVLDIEGDNMAADVTLIWVAPTARRDGVDVEVRMYEVKYGERAASRTYPTKLADAQRGIDDLFTAELRSRFNVRTLEVFWTPVELVPKRASDNGTTASAAASGARIPITVQRTEASTLLTRTFVSMLIDEDVTLRTVPAAQSKTKRYTARSAEAFPTAGAAHVDLREKPADKNENPDASAGSGKTSVPEVASGGGTTELKDAAQSDDTPNSSRDFN